MTDKEVLQKAIEIATKNGMSIKVIDDAAFYSVYMKKTRRGTAMVKDYRDVDTKKCYGVIFSHDFAKAFWGDRLKCFECGTYLEGGSEGCCDYQIPKIEWRYHLQQMVLCDNPIDYLRKFMPSMVAGETKIIGQRNWKEGGTFDDKFIDNTEKPTSDSIKEDLNQTDADEE